MFKLLRVLTKSATLGVARKPLRFQAWGSRWLATQQLSNKALLQDQRQQHIKRGDFREAISCEEQLHNMLLSENKSSPEVASSHIVLGMLYNKIGQIDKCIGHQEAALKIYEEQKVENPTVMTIVGGIGMGYIANNDKAKAAPLLKRAIDMHKRLKVHNTSAANIYFSLADCLNEEGKHIEAAQTMLDAATIFDEVRNRAEAAYAYFEAAVSFEQGKDYNTAINWFKHVIGYILQHSLPPSGIGPTSYYHIGTCNLAMDKFTESYLTRLHSSYCSLARSDWIGFK